MKNKHCKNISYLQKKCDVSLKSIANTERQLFFMKDAIIAEQSLYKSMKTRDENDDITKNAIKEDE